MYNVAFDDNSKEASVLAFSRSNVDELHDRNPRAHPLILCRPAGAQGVRDAKDE
jgi:hypothetical protein